MENLSIQFASSAVNKIVIYCGSEILTFDQVSGRGVFTDTGLVLALIGI